MRETDLYGPVKGFLEAQGYEVKGEVKDCDVVAVRGDELVVVELKPGFNLDLVFQGIERQRLGGTVYLAVAAPRRRRSSRWKDIRRLCERLGLGLMAVGSDAGRPAVEVLCDPATSTRVAGRKGRSLLLKEFRERTGDHNIGGSTRRPVVTAYRELALRAAQQLKAAGPSGLADLRESTGCLRVGTLLQKNYYGWFERVGRGVYRLTPSGETALALYADVVEAWEKPEPRSDGATALTAPPGAL